jgi:predicted GIY-YIG superfamily endonuclease
LEIEEQEHSQPRPVAEAIAYVHHWVYFLHDEADELLYVGITCTGTGRMLQHAREKGWWPQVDHIQIEHFESRDEALAREAEVIAERRPPFNRALPRGVKA